MGLKKEIDLQPVAQPQEKRGETLASWPHPSRRSQGNNATTIVFLIRAQRQLDVRTLAICTVWDASQNPLKFDWRYSSYDNYQMWMHRRSWAFCYLRSSNRHRRNRRFSENPVLSQRCRIKVAH
ncbi:hypothetical protein ABVK25_008727 [Lepraria finkii]|uniref:Uncharacterized protein n=1 Tax=Lepraria finkii TaxID=1340010 RepID=A0ABR4AZ98_9LECA